MRYAAGTLAHEETADLNPSNEPQECLEAEHHAENAIVRTDGSAKAFLYKGSSRQS